jgi:hypothetical protein
MLATRAARYTGARHISAILFFSLFFSFVLVALALPARWRSWRWCWRYRHAGVLAL